MIFDVLGFPVYAGCPELDCFLADVSMKSHSSFSKLVLRFTFRCSLDHGGRRTEAVARVRRVLLGAGALLLAGCSPPIRCRVRLRVIGPAVTVRKVDAALFSGACSLGLTRCSVNMFFQVFGKRWLSSRLFRFSGRFSISIASVIVLLEKFSLTARTFVLAKSILCSVLITCWASEEVTVFCLTALMCSSLLVLTFRFV
ncbi:MAG: hypothetical protein KTM48_03075, partial [Wolbachia endosymbiont of Pissodes strobi]|nr:hypothetical protein [Wolbachia endosymbiont of Pissodes strobi]